MRRQIELTTGRDRIVDVTGEVAAFVRGRSGEGIVHVFLPHATAGLALVETGAGSDADLLDTLDRLVPRDDHWRHRHGSPGHGADHVVPALLAPSITIPVADGELLLGTWQSIVVVDPNVDNPTRQLVLTFVATTA